MRSNKMNDTTMTGMEILAGIAIRRARGNKTRGVVTWTAKNSSTFLNGSRPARTVLGAVRAAIAYGNGELMGEGVITIMQDGITVREYRAGLVHGSPRNVWTRTDLA
jgi:hypothetical protein